MGSEPQTWDFVIVGSGPAGSALASKLALSKSQPSVLLLEAGQRQDDPTLRISGKRWQTFQNGDMNWGYKTIPQEHCDGRELDYSRGKVLGGSSAINFGVYTVGTKDDYDTWAEIVGDDTFAWEKMQRRFKELESFDSVVKNDVYKSFASADPLIHGDHGPLKIGYPAEFEDDLSLVMNAFLDSGFKANFDHNSGDPIGIGMGINSVHSGLRSTAADLLDAVEKRGRLEIKTGKAVTKVLFDGTKAVGVEAAGKTFLATKELILSAGSLDTPRILMHSGIGPAEHLTQFNIPVLKDLPAIGQNLADHPHVPLLFARNPTTNDRNAFFGSESAMSDAQTQWVTDKTGPWAKYASQVIMGYLKSDAVLQSSEFASLPDDVKAFLNKPTIPHYEVISHFPIHLLDPRIKDYSYISIVAFLMNEQSRGEVRLQSSDPSVPLLFNPNILAHPYDQRVCIESIREILAMTRHESFAKDTVATLLAPKSDSDEDILDFWRGACATAWHMTGTVKMGTSEEDAAVDNGFRVFGIQGLRVADMSVVPVLTNNHTQATAYGTGVTCADVLIGEYGLDE